MARIGERSRRMLVCIVAALAAAAIIGGLRSMGFYWLDRLLLVPFLIGALASGNPHQPNEVVSWSALFVILLLLALLVSRVSQVMRRRPETMRTRNSGRHT